MRRAVTIGIAALAALLPSLGAASYFVILAQSSLAQPVYTATKILMLAILFGVLATKRIALPALRATRREIVSGMVHGLMIAALLGLATMLGQTALTDAAPAIVEKINNFPLLARHYLAAAIAFSILHSLFEEYYWRGMMGNLLSSLSNRWVTVIVGSLAFTAHHVIVLSQFFSPLMTVIASVGVWIAGAAWMLLYTKEHNLLAPWLSHIIADLAIFFVGYTLVT